jgi:Fibrinogen beta and gamma chains, C-terminal globular domain
MFVTFGCLISSGNDIIHLLTNGGRRYKLRVDLGDFNGNTRYAEYTDFKIGPAWDKYKLVSLGTFNGTAGTFACILCDSFHRSLQDNMLEAHVCIQRLLKTVKLTLAFQPHDAYENLCCSFLQRYT